MIDERRRERLGALFQREIADIIATKVRDVRVGMVSVTGVRVSADLGVAKVYVSVLGDAQVRSQAMASLARATPFIRGEVARRVRLRQIPELRFVEDDSIRKAAEVERLLREWHRERDESEPAP